MYKVPICCGPWSGYTIATGDALFQFDQSHHPYPSNQTPSNCRATASATCSIARLDLRVVLHVSEEILRLIIAPSREQARRMCRGGAEQRLRDSAAVMPLRIGQIHNRFRSSFLRDLIRIDDQHSRPRREAVPHPWWRPIFRRKIVQHLAE